MKRSFTLSPEAVAYVGEIRERRGAGSDSEALDMFLRDAILEARRQQIDAACKEYYDTASGEELAEQLQWAEMVGPNILIGLPE
jgi:hypothetical protein